MSELIEKQKVLDALREIATEKFSLDDPYGVYINALIDVEEKICSLPVVQPNGPDNLVKDSQGLAKDLVNDCISRKAAIERIDEALARVFKEPCGELILRKVPSAQPERMRGKWIAVTEDGDVYKRICSCCEQEAFFQNDDPDELYDGGRYELSDFCPNCGADMREVDDERPD